MKEQKPINDAMEHLNKIEGYPSNVDLEKLPKPIRYFGYFFIAFFTISAVLFIFFSLFY